MIHHLFMAQPQGQQGSNPLVGFLPFILLIVVFYFFLIRPQTKKQREHQEMLNSLQKGDRVITNGGIIGTVVGTDEEKVVIKVGGADAVKLEVARGFISQKLNK